MSCSNQPGSEAVKQIFFPFQILEFEGESPTPEEIQSQCRKLSRKWHPDKYKGEEEKAEAQEKFIEIQKACDVLNELRKKRQDRNMKSDFGYREKEDRYNKQETATKKEKFDEYREDL